MYGTLKAALLWYELFAWTLVRKDFVLNPYEACIANKEVEGGQVTIAWYVDDLKIGHKNPKVVSKVKKYLESKFGRMRVNRGMKHTYLGMNIEFKDQKVQIHIKDYVKECIESFGEAINSTAKNPANYTVNGIPDLENDQVLDDEKAKKTIAQSQSYFIYRKEPDWICNLLLGFSAPEYSSSVTVIGKS